MNILARAVGSVRIAHICVSFSRSHTRTHSFHCAAKLLRTTLSMCTCIVLSGKKENCSQSHVCVYVCAQERFKFKVISSLQLISWWSPHTHAHRFRGKSCHCSRFEWNFDLLLLVSSRKLAIHLYVLLTFYTFYRFRVCNAEEIFSPKIECFLNFCEIFLFTYRYIALNWQQEKKNAANILTVNKCQMLHSLRLLSWILWRVY